MTEYEQFSKALMHEVANAEISAEEAARRDLEWRILDLLDLNNVPPDRATTIKEELLTFMR